jgi:hypothetical protein
VKDLEHVLRKTRLFEAVGEMLRKQSAKCSATSAVWLECFITTLLPARIAGSTAFSAVM